MKSSSPNLIPSNRPHQIGKTKLQVVHDEASGFWTGRPWLVVSEEGKPAEASFKTDGEAFDYIDERIEEDFNDEQEGMREN